MDVHDYRPLLDRLVAIAAADERILAVLLYGSHARGEADEYSYVLAPQAPAHSQAAATSGARSGPGPQKAAANAHAA